MASTQSTTGSVSPDFIKGQRWFRAKARSIESVEIVDILAIPGTHFQIVLIRVIYAEGDSDTYLITNRDDAPQGEIREALSDARFRQVLLNAILRNQTISGRTGDVIASRSSTLDQQDDGIENIESRVSGAEQSNTSIIYGDRFILKLFRKIEPGINPDLEIGTFLTEHGFAYTPAVLGKIEYRIKGDGETYAAGILQKFVPNRGDAWKYTLESLDDFFNRVSSREDNPPAVRSYHPLELADGEIPPEFSELLGSYKDSAHLLGKRTAEMHAALSDSTNPDFAPEQFTREQGEKLYQEMLGQADITFELLRRKQAVLKDDSAENARKLLHIEHRVMERLAAIRGQPVTAWRIRYHGDFHLGQVLYTGEDFMIIDFEGEPARPLSGRRGKTLAMRDVAGMIRSFQYAAYMAVSKQSAAAEPWAALWNAWVGATYLKAYFENARGHRFTPGGAREKRVLFDVFLIQKALYEVAYELNNRPDWVHIPLRGILSLMS